MASNITVAQLSELKGLNNPPVVVKDLVSATALLLGYTEQQAKDWKFCRKILKEQRVLIDKLKNYDSKSCDPASVTLAKTLMAAMTREVVMKVGFAAVGLFDWNVAAITAADGGS